MTRLSAFFRTSAACFMLMTCLFVAGTSMASADQARHKPSHKNPDALWHFVHGQCAPEARKGTFPPAPCAEVTSADDPTRGYVVFKDRDGRYQYLLLPLARITGIESPVLLEPATPNYMGIAWQMRLYTEAALHRRVPRQALSLVVNSAYGRSQNQLHIHIDCIRPDVHARLEQQLPTLTEQWRLLPVRLPDRKGHRYLARWVPGRDLSINPFHDLKAALPSWDRMRRHSLVAVGARRADGTPGFVLLSTRAIPHTDNNGNSDDLQDRSCAIVDEDAR